MAYTYQDNLGRFHGDIRAGPDGNADICLRQGGRVVDSVPHHGHFSVLPLEAFNFFRFLRGQDFGLDAIFLDSNLTTKREK